jgi:hypothetical protein
MMLLERTQAPPCTAISMASRLPVLLMSGCVFMASGVFFHVANCIRTIWVSVRCAVCASGKGLG